MTIDPDCPRCGHYPCECPPMTDAQRTELTTLRARVEELENRERRIRDAAFHPLFNSLEAVATIKTILTLG